MKPWAPYGLGFEHSAIHRRGQQIAIAALPRPAVVLEYAGAEVIRRICTGHRQKLFRRHLQILWQFDFELEIWRELGRAYDEAEEESYAWAKALMPIAELALNGGLPAPPFEAHAIAARIVQTLDDALDGVPPETRGAVLGALMPQIHGRIAAYIG